MKQQKPQIGAFVLSHNLYCAEPIGIFFEPYLGGNSLFEQFDVRNDADGFVAFGLEFFERVQSHVERVGVERAEAFINKKAFDFYVLGGQI